MESYFNISITKKQAGLTISISDKTDFKTKQIRTDKVFLIISTQPIKRTCISKHINPKCHTTSSTGAKATQLAVCELTQSIDMSKFLGKFTSQKANFKT